MTLGFMLLALLAALALSAPINPQPSGIVTFTNCEAAGSAAQNVTGGSHLMTVTGEDTYVCYSDSGSTCGSGGTLYPSGTVIHITFGNASKSVSCRSAASGGDLQFTKAP